MLAIVAYAIHTLSRWAFLSMLPVVVMQKFSSGSTIVIALALELLPRVLFAPLIAKIMLRKGAKNVASIAIICCAPIYISLLHIDSHTFLQVLMLLLGFFDAAITAAALVIRSQVALAGKNITTNAIFATAERSSKMIGPALASIFLRKLSILHSTYIIVLFSVVASVLLFASPVQRKSTSISQSQPVSYCAFLSLFRKNPVLWSLFVPTLGYALILGAISLFLYWANTAIFQKPEDLWTILLTLRGAGAVIGGLLASKILHFTQKKTPLLKAWPWIGLTRALCFLPLALTTQWEFFLVALVIAGLPEMLAGVCFFTLMQRHLPPHQAEIFYSLSAPIFYGCIILGTLLGGLYTQNLIGLGEFWLLISMLCLGTALPFLPRIRTPRYA